MTTFSNHFVTKFTLTLLFLFVGAMSIMAEPYAEGFDNITGTEDNLHSVPEGWDVIGTLRNFNLSKRYYKTSSPSLCYTSGGNTSDYLVTPLVSGKILFWYYGTNARTKGNMQVYECNDENGTLTIGAPIGTAITVPCQKWTQYTIELTEGKRLAILMSRTAIDDFYAESKGDDGGDTPPVFVEKKALTALSLERVSNYEVTANKDNQYEMLFHVKVQNSGNIGLAADEISVSITDNNGNALGTATATDSLKTDSTVIIPVSVTADAGQGGYLSFHAKENLTNTYVKNEAGNNAFVNAHITAYFATFAILDPNGVKLLSDELIPFDTNNTAVTRTVTIKNEGTAPLKINSINLPEGFTTPEDTFSVAAGSQKSVDITMTISKPFGIKQGDVTINHALGAFTFAVKGTTIDPSVYFENFEDDKLPESWTIGEKWTITSQSGNHYMQQNSVTDTTTAIITPLLAVNEGEVMTFDAKRAYATNAATLTVSYSLNKTDWTTVGSYELASLFDTYTLNAIPTGDVYLKFEGRYVAIDNLAGFHISSTPTTVRPQTSDFRHHTSQSFDLLGRKTTKTKGVVIINGKKYNKK